MSTGGDPASHMSRREHARDLPRSLPRYPATAKPIFERLVRRTRHTAQYLRSLGGAESARTRSLNRAIQEGNGVGWLVRSNSHLSATLLAAVRLSPCRSASLQHRATGRVLVEGEPDPETAASPRCPNFRQVLNLCSPSRSSAAATSLHRVGHASIAASAEHRRTSMSAQAGWQPGLPGRVAGCRAR